MVYAPTAKLEKFTGKEDDAQIWLNNQGENEAVTTYLGCFHRNLHQIQAIQADYFTTPQILNQFIRGLYSSILQHVYSIHPANLQAAVTNTKDFKAAELKANHAQAINLVMNGSSELDSKLKQFSDSINQKLEEYLANNCTIYQPPQQRNYSKNQWQQKTHACHYCNKQEHLQFKCRKWLIKQKSGPQTISTKLCIYDTTANLSTTNLLANNTHYLSITVLTHLLATALGNLSAPTNSNTATELTSKQNPKAKIDPTKLEIINGSPSTNLHLLITSKDAQPNNLKTNQQSTLISNISPATVTNNELLTAIFPFKLEELIFTSLFSGATLKKKPITIIYTDAKVDGHPIKLILDSRLAGSIITRQLMDQLATKTPIDEIDNLLIKINGIMWVGHIQKIQITYQRIAGHQAEKKIDKLIKQLLNLCPLYKELIWKTFRYQLLKDIINNRTSTNKHHPKISSLLGTPVNIEPARETFYKELIQNTNLPTNHNFASIITEINKEIEHHIQQRYPITYTSKGKRKLQIPAVTSRKIQLRTWKKTRVESPTNLSYYYTPRSVINILSTDMKTELLGPYGKYFERFKSNLITTNLITENSEVETLNLQTQQNLNLKNLEIETPNIQPPPNQNNQNPNLINQPDLPSIIIINPPPQIQQPLVLLPQPPQPNLDPMAYAPIINDVAKAITTNNWDNTRTMQVISYFLKDTADSWYYKFLRYFSDNNSINHLASTFTTIKQRDTETQVRPMHSVNLPTAMTHVRDFEAAELEANHAQAVNLVINGSSDLDSKLKQFNDNINQKLESYLANNHAIYQPPNDLGNANYFQN
ncbi:hypothetical protein G9A89_015802 [Geosiphon pyriformis]|nr:hypothetical protein G9A89_015802 [Geosiphon pyriformis]